jgi:methyl-accepting chemotaxis protein
MKNVNIGKKLTIGFGVVTTIMVILTTIAFVNMKRTDSRFSQVIDLNASRIEKANTAIRAVDQIFYAMAVVLMTEDQGLIRENTKLIAEKRKEENDAFEALEKLGQTEKSKGFVAQCKSIMASGKGANNKAMELAKAGKREEAMMVYVKDARPFALQIIAAMEDLVRYEQKEMKAAHQAASRESGTYQVLLVVLGIIGLGMVVVATTYLTRSITIPLKEGLRVADRLAKGDLNVVVTSEGRDEVGQLLTSMKNMVEKWRGVVGQVASTAASLSSAATELSASADQMSRGSSVQAERATMVASSSEEMSHTVLDVARNAGSISQSAGKTAATARDGGSVVNRAVDEVKEIAITVNDSARFVRSLGDRSKQIGEIVGVINDIADQTNLLALNAAIEAARAGDQGRGFAVVADEVRKLAERTASSTSEIGTMIKGIQDEVGKAVEVMARATAKVDQGVKYSEEAGDSLGVIVKSVDDLQLMVQQIASATEEMSATSDQISKDVEQIATISRETSMSSEQTAVASGDLANLSVALENIVRGFRL